ncbi:MAG: 2-dehydropantoate 2-reductase, partial [Candidatus Dormibacteraeota bacterium]|nr:2-dehydropantoate 2-reductase [Candidatus Dormibacteraeota bacterium]
MRFAVVGAGAIGSLVGGLLHRAGADVVLIARGPHLQAMRERGLRLLDADGTSVEVRPRCTDDLGAVAGADSILVTLKAHALPGIAAPLAGAAAMHAVLLFAQNGVPWWWRGPAGARLEAVDPGGTVSSAFAGRRILGCIAYPAATVVEPGVVRHEEGDRLALGSPDGSEEAAAQELAAAFTGAGLRGRVPPRFREEVWVKLLGNATFNPVSALTRATLGEMLADPACRDLLRALMLEVEAVGRAQGLEPGVEIERRLRGAAGAAHHRSSMLQDLEAGRPLE